MNGTRQGLRAAQCAGALAACLVLVGRWSFERLVGIESDRYFTLNTGMLLEPRHYLLPCLFLTLLSMPVGHPRMSRPGPLVAPAYQHGAYLLYVLLSVYLICSLAWAPSFENGLLKSYEIALVAGVSLCARFWMGSALSHEFRESFWVTLILTTGCLAVMALVSLTTDRMAVLGGGPNMFARLMAVLAIGCVGAVRRFSLVWHGCAAAAVGLVVLSGSRGGIIAAAAGMAALLVFDHRRMASKVQLLASLGAAFLLLMYLTPLGSYVSASFSLRIVEMTLENAYTSDRDILIEAAIDLWREKPLFGIGIGGWERFAGELGSYPHNLFAEMLCEGGIVALALALGWIALLALHGLRNRAQLHAPSLAGAVMFLMASQFSGDFFDSRGILLLMVLTVTPRSRHDVPCANGPFPPRSQFGSTIMPHHTVARIRGRKGQVPCGFGL